MSKWLASGRRRDLCAILYGTEGLRGQALKSRIEAHYDERIDPSSFYGALDSLVSKGFVEERTEGIHDVYALTDAGRAGVEEQFEWLGEQLEATESGSEKSGSEESGSEESGSEESESEESESE